MHIVFDGMPCSFVRCLEEWSDVHVEADIRERSGDYLGATIVSVLTQLDDQQARPPAFLLCEGSDLVLDPRAGTLTRAGTVIDLSVKELQILEVFMRNPGRVLTRLEILEGAWDEGYEHRSNVIDVYIRYLREKIDRPFDRSTLETVRGAGYRLRRDDPEGGGAEHPPR